MRCLLLSGAGALLALAAACRAPAGDGRAPAEDRSTFEYLSAKYDRDSDGAIELAEYARGSDSFARLDANGDGRLTQDDFPDERWSRDLGIRDLPADVRARLGARYAARAVVLAYFHPDPGPGDPALSREALATGFGRLDLDASGALDAAEFARATDALPWGGPGDAWELLLAAVDAPSGGLVARAELERYRAEMADDAGVLRGPPGVDPRAVLPGLAGDGPPVGALAPDFELAPPQGGPRVRLSEWRGRKPVALVFGSYT